MSEKPFKGWIHDWRVLDRDSGIYVTGISDGGRVIFGNVCVAYYDAQGFIIVETESSYIMLNDIEGGNSYELLPWRLGKTEEQFSDDVCHCCNCGCSPRS